MEEVNFSVKEMDFKWSRVKMFIGKGGYFLRTSKEEMVYVGGFVGQRYNTTVGLFAKEKDLLDFKGMRGPDPKSDTQKMQASNIGRTGALAAWDHKGNCLVMFGGQNTGAHESARQRMMWNDVLLFDLKRMKVLEQHVFTELNVKKRHSHCGFLIDDNLFSIGGQSQHKVLDEFIELNIRKGVHSDAKIEKGAQHLEPVYSAAIAPVFYISKMSQNGSLSLK